MRIQTNVSSLLAWRTLTGAGSKADSALGRLASGQRINAAADDVAGLGLSQHFRSQFMGLAQATRNALDGLGLVNTAESALGEVADMLQRGRELAVQAANGVWSDEQKGAIQTELDHILEEVDRVSDMTLFNGRQVLGMQGASAATSGALMGLRSGWLEQAEKVIEQYYGITGDGSTLSIYLTNQAWQPGSITGAPDLNGMLSGITMTLDAGALSHAQDPDRIVARTLTQAVLARNSNYMNLESWFISGASDLIAGGRELLQSAIAAHGATAVVNALTGPWADDLLHHASAYLAVSYLNSELNNNGMTMADMIAWLKLGSDLNAAFAFTLGGDTLRFTSDFQANGQAYLDSLIAGGALSGSDVGGINPGDSVGVIPDGGQYGLNPTTGFSIAWQAFAEDRQVTLQVGANDRDQLTFTLPQVNRSSLDLIGIDLVRDAGAAIERFSQAISKVSYARGQLGGVANSLEHTINSISQYELTNRTSFSRIVDADFALELANLTKQQILVSASANMLVKANFMRESILSLLDGVPGSRSAFV